MLKATKRLVIVSEKVNKYGFRVLVDGVDLEQYEKNPIMLFMHIRPFSASKDQILPLGNVIELKKEVIDGEKVITGLPVFDDSDEFAMSIYHKYENGTLRMGSAGLIPRAWTADESLIIEGQTSETLSRSAMEEVSIVDIGADNDALSQIALYDENHNRIELSSSSENAAIPMLNQNNIDMSKIELTAAKAAQLLGKAEIQTADQLETEIMNVVQLAARQKTEIESLTREKTELQTKLDDEIAVQLAAKIESLVQGAVDARKITADEKPDYVALAAKDYESVERLLGQKAGLPTIQSQIESGKTDNVSLYAGKTWDDLDRAGTLVKLKSEDLNLFRELYKAKFGNDYSE